MREGYVRVPSAGQLEPTPTSPPPRRVDVDRAFELLRFAIIGGLSAALNFAIIIFLTSCLGLHYLLSITSCFVIVTFVSFWFNRVWTYRKRRGAARDDLARYLAMTAAQYVVCLGGCGVCVAMFHVPYQWAVLVLTILLAPLNYLLHRRWSFRLKWIDQGT
ncbi:MAG TPA: GtrA family protein [Steroidobacteraceae bacterium]|jgi:putative flippase GtrA|nr:GtrA family protein [Steroidobacteraceae bacterium]